MYGRRPTFLGMNLQQYREAQRTERLNKQKQAAGGPAKVESSASSSSESSSATATPKNGSGKGVASTGGGGRLDPLEGGGSPSDYATNIASSLASHSSASSSASSLSSLHRSRTSSSSSSQEGISVKTFSIFLPHSQKSLSLRLRGDATIEELQRAVLSAVEAEVPPGTRLRVLGIPKGDPSLPLSELKLKAPSRLVTMPSPSHLFGPHPGSGAAAAHHAQQQQHQDPTRAFRWLQERIDSSHACVLRDADEDPVSWSDDDEFERRVKLRIKQYKGYIRLAPLDPRKKNLVLDLDFSVMDTAIYNSDLSATPRKWRRPFVADLLAAVYEHYNLIVWSATGNAFVESKLYEMGLLTDNRFNLALLIDYGAMVRVKLRRHGGQVKEFNTKPLSVIWGKWKETNADNTVIVDDHRRSFLLNAPNGIHVTAYKAKTKAVDRELELLAKYLIMIKDLPSLRGVHHEWWREVASDRVPLSRVLIPVQPLAADGSSATITTAKALRKQRSGGGGVIVDEGAPLGGLDLPAGSGLVAPLPMIPMQMQMGMPVHPAHYYPGGAGAAGSAGVAGAGVGGGYAPTLSPTTGLPPGALAGLRSLEEAVMDEKPNPVIEAELVNEEIQPPLRRLRSRSEPRPLGTRPFPVVGGAAAASAAAHPEVAAQLAQERHHHHHHSHSQSQHRPSPHHTGDHDDHGEEAGGPGAADGGEGYDEVEENELRLATMGMAGGPGPMAMNYEDVVVTAAAPAMGFSANSASGAIGINRSGTGSAISFSDRDLFSNSSPVIGLSSGPGSSSAAGTQPRGPFYIGSASRSSGSSGNNSNANNANSSNNRRMMMAVDGDGYAYSSDSGSGSGSDDEGGDSGPLSSVSGDRSRSGASSSLSASGFSGVSGSASDSDDGEGPAGRDSGAPFDPSIGGHQYYFENGQLFRYDNRTGISVVAPEGSSSIGASSSGLPRSYSDTDLHLQQVLAARKPAAMTAVPASAQVQVPVHMQVPRVRSGSGAAASAAGPTTPQPPPSLGAARHVQPGAVATPPQSLMAGAVASFGGALSGSGTMRSTHQQVLLQRPAATLPSAGAMATPPHSSSAAGAVPVPSSMPREGSRGSLFGKATSSSSGSGVPSSFSPAGLAAPPATSAAGTAPAMFAPQPGQLPPQQQQHQHLAGFPFKPIAVIGGASGSSGASRTDSAGHGRR